MFFATLYLNKFTEFCKKFGCK